MSELQTIKVPDIGDFDAVEVIEVLVSIGDKLDIEQSLVTVESDKASLEIPSPVEGIVTAVLVNQGDKVSQGTDLFVVDVAETAAVSAAELPAPASDNGTDSNAAGMALSLIHI